MSGSASNGKMYGSELMPWAVVMVTGVGAVVFGGTWLGGPWAQC